MILVECKSKINIFLHTKLELDEDDVILVGF